jgi:hypothetical protein
LSFEIFSSSPSIEKLINIFHLAEESPLEAKFGFSWIFNPLAKFGEIAIPKSD